MASMRDDLNAALDSVDGDYDETVQTIDDGGSEELSSGAATEGAEQDLQSLDGESAELSTEADTGEGEDDSLAGDPAAAADPEAKGDGEPVQPGDVTLDAKDKESVKAPIDWSPKEREDWSRIPRHLQDKIKQREADTANLMQETASARRTHNEFSGLVQQYGSVLSGVAGDTPMQAVESLFSTVANLRMGSPIQKAQVIADLVNDFGVDINALDTTLSGQMPEQGAGSEIETRLEQMLNERMAPFTQYEQQMQRQQQQQQETMQTGAVNEVKSFADGGKAEFLNDVRMDMADLIEMAGNRGHNMGMEEAYNKACALNPQVSQVIEQRKQQAALTASQNSIGAKQTAASSIVGNRSGLNTGAGNLSMRDQIAAAWDGQD